MIELINKLKSKWDINENIDDENKSIEIVIRLIKVCNENCLFCNTNLDKSVIIYEDLVKIIDYFIDKYFTNYSIYFSLSWWEPTIYKNFDKIVEYICQKWINIKIQTNAVMFSNKSFIEKIIKYKNYISFFISFHSHIEKIYNHITSSNLYYSSLLWIKNIYNNFDSDSIKINVVLNKININFFHEQIKFFDKFFSNYDVNIIISIIYPNKSYHKKLLVSYNKVVDVINTLNYTGKVKIIYEFWWYCQMPRCFFTKLKVDDFSINEVWLDLDVWVQNMVKPSVCKKCIYNYKCIGLPRLYLEEFNYEEIIPIIK